MDEELDDVETPVEFDPIGYVQNAIAEGISDGSMLAGFVVVAEWFEADGTPTLSVFGSKMTPWHMNGLLTYALETHAAPVPAMAEYVLDDEDDDDF